MPVSLFAIYRSAAWLALGLGLVACAASGEPAAETSRPTGITPKIPTEGDGQPADPPPTTTEEPVAPPTAAREEPTVLPTSPTASPALVLPDLDPAPDITNEVWLNTDQPLNLDALRGRVVLVEFWTFG